MAQTAKQGQMQDDPGVSKVVDLDAEKQSVGYRQYRHEVIDLEGKCSYCGKTEWLRLYHPDDTLLALYEPDNAVVLCRGCHMKEYISKEGIERSGRGFKTHLKITVAVLSNTSGRHKETVRRHIRDGTLDPNDLGSINNWLNKNRREVCK
ncbi:hypothetical protein KAR91_53090 [Candidatus Pacearchaeota archaeon]|nr:hypothetical protein [Candidatus Pacearchaeota archaeon]